MSFDPNVTGKGKRKLDLMEVDENPIKESKNSFLDEKIQDVTIFGTPLNQLNIHFKDFEIRTLQCLDRVKVINNFSQSSLLTSGLCNLIALSIFHPEEFQKDEELLEELISTAEELKEFDIEKITLETLIKNFPNSNRIEKLADLYQQKGSFSQAIVLNGQALDILLEINHQVRMGKFMLTNEISFFENFKRLSSKLISLYYADMHYSDAMSLYNHIFAKNLKHSQIDVNTLEILGDAAFELDKEELCYQFYDEVKKQLQISFEDLSNKFKNISYKSEAISNFSPLIKTSHSLIIPSAELNSNMIKGIEIDLKWAIALMKFGKGEEAQKKMQTTLLNAKIRLTNSNLNKSDEAKLRSKIERSCGQFAKMKNATYDAFNCFNKSLIYLENLSDGMDKFHEFALTFYEMGEYNKAAELIKKCLEAKPGHLEYWHLWRKINRMAPQ